MSGCGHDHCDWPDEQVWRFDKPMTLERLVGDGDFDPPIVVEGGDSMLVRREQIVVYRQGEASEVYQRHAGLAPSRRWQMERQASGAHASSYPVAAGVRQGEYLHRPQGPVLGVCGQRVVTCFSPARFDDPPFRRDVGSGFDRE